jgi:ankyrin repeat protein
MTRGGSLTLTVYSAEVNIVTRDHSSPLILSAQNGHLGCVKLLLKAGADVDTTDDSGKPALAYAVKSDSLDIAEALIQRGANVNLEITELVGRHEWETKSLLSLATSEEMQNLLREAGAE